MIPRVLHQIWLGPEMPADVRRWTEGWRAAHPDWQHRMWRDSDVPELRNQGLYDAAPTYAMKADVLRYEILHTFGGVYVDADFECHRPLGPLVERRSRLLVSEYGVVTNSIMGCEPEDRLLGLLAEELAHRFVGVTPQELDAPHEQTGPYFVDELYVAERLAESSPDDLVPGDYFFAPRTRNPAALSRAAKKRYATHHALATWRDPTSLTMRLRRTRLRTRVRRFIDLTAP